MSDTSATNQNPTFSELFSEFSEKSNFKPGSLLNAKIIDITHDYVIVDAGLKSVARIPRSEFLNFEGKLEANVEIGANIDVFVDMIEDGTGETILSREKARRITAWRNLEEAFAMGKNVIGIISESVRGGFTVDVEKIKAFLPGSLLDVKPVSDPSYLLRRELEFKVIKIDKEKNNIVLSRRAALLTIDDSKREALMQNLHEGDIVTGIVKNLTDYGAFIDLGGFDGLLHITDISWKRIRHPNEILKVGEEIKVKILKFDREKNRISLGLKQMVEDPWKDIERRYPNGARVFGKVTNIADYGCFVEIEPCIEGLVHISEMDWTNKNVNPTKVVSLGKEVEVMVLDINAERRRISLGLKQCKPNPWKEFASTHAKGEKITGKVKSITDFGIFLGLEGDIDGLVHISDLSWSESGEDLLHNYKKGQEVEAVIIGVDAERERISLGIKQLEKDIYADFLAAHPKGSIVTGKVVNVNSKEALIGLGEHLIGRIRTTDVSVDKVQDVTEYLKVGEEIEAKVMGIDKKSRYINLSIKAMHAEMSEKTPTNTQLGDLLKEQMEEKESQL